MDDEIIHLQAELKAAREEHKNLSALSANLAIGKQTAERQLAEARALLESAREFIRGLCGRPVSFDKLLPHPEPDAVREAEQEVLKACRIDWADVIEALPEPGFTDRKLAVIKLARSCKILAAAKEQDD